MAELHALEMVTQMIDPDGTITWHLQSAHYPPIHPDFILVAKQAIRLANKGKWDQVIKYPNGLKRTVKYTIQGLRLENFLDN